jgi:hypothetical protein
MRRRRWWLGGLAVAALIVIVLAPLASPDPDGLQRVAQDQGFLGRAQAAVVHLLPGYTVPGIDDGTVSRILAGLVGVTLVFVLAWGLGVLLRRRRGAGDQDES